MRAGLLNKTIVIERATETVGPAGKVSRSWTPLATRRAQVVQASTDEFMRGERGVSTETTIVFRIWFTAGITVADRITYEGAAYDIKQLKELGHRQGLELRCERVGP